VHLILRDKGGVSWTEKLLLAANPLLGLSTDHVDQLFASGMPVEGMAATRIHICPHHQELLVGNDVRTADPFIECPW
jgi:hypothetical protein